MSAEVEALLARLDRTARNKEHPMLPDGIIVYKQLAADASAVIRAQAEEITRLKMKIEILRALSAAAARQEPVKATCFHTINPKDAEDDHGFALKPGRYAMYPADLKLYAAPVPAGDAVSALTAGGVCAKCGFTYWEHRGHIIACPVCECERLRAVADAAKAFAPHWNRTWDEDEDPTIQQETGDALAAAVRALERDEVKS